MSGGAWRALPCNVPIKRTHEASQAWHVHVTHQHTHLLDPFPPGWRSRGMSPNTQTRARPGLCQVCCCTTQTFGGRYHNGSHVKVKSSHATDLRCLSAAGTKSKPCSGNGVVGLDGSVPGFQSVIRSHKSNGHGPHQCNSHSNPPQVCNVTCAVLQKEGTRGSTETQTHAKEGDVALLSYTTTQRMVRPLRCRCKNVRKARGVQKQVASNDMKHANGTKTMPSHCGNCKQNVAATDGLARPLQKHEPLSFGTSFGSTQQMRP